MRRPRAAFTLIELLMVMGIILVLASLLLSSMSSAKKLAARVTCQSNMRQILMATHQYVLNDPEGRLPYANWGGSGGAYDPGPTQPGWLYNYPNNGAKPTDMRTGALYKYIQNDGIYHCPLHAPPYLGNGPTENITSYLINGAVCGYGSKAPSWTWTSFKDPVRQMLYFECATTNGIAMGNFTPGANNYTSLWNDGSSFPWENVLTDRHGTGASVGFFDFHVEYYDRNEYVNQLNFSPGGLWCNPGSPTGH